VPRRAGGQSRTYPVDKPVDIEGPTAARMAVGPYLLLARLVDGKDQLNAGRHDEMLHHEAPETTQDVLHLGGGKD
jgi:hypothetical protein